MLKIGNKFIVKDTGDKAHPFYLSGQFDGTWHAIPVEQRHITKPDPFVGLPAEIKAQQVVVNAEGKHRTFENISRDKALLTAVLHFSKWLDDYGTTKDGRVLAAFEVGGDRVIDERYK